MLFSQLNVKMMVYNIEICYYILKMTTIMSRVICSLFKMKIDESKWKSHKVSTNHLQKCGEIHKGLTTNFSKMFFDIKPEIEELYNLEFKKTHDFWQLFFSPKVPKEKFNTLCNDSIDKTEIENSLSNNFNIYISGITPFIGKNYFI